MNSPNSEKPLIMKLFLRTVAHSSIDSYILLNKENLQIMKKIQIMAVPILSLSGGSTVQYRLTVGERH